ncbi:MAG TPA: pitrilysin family protein [Candidatus Binatia bacterium]|nr:pitrilysin family protein [Candidatus Binatia bacterium]
MNARRPVLLTMLSLALAAIPARAQTPPVVEATLDNGLRVLVLEDRRSPVVSVQTWYRVGARNEQVGATGLAHFLEHLMFKGTPSVAKGEFTRTVTREGGQYNAFTSQDVTSYYVNIASDRVDQVLGLEADRMRNLLLDAGEIDSERQVVMEERRTRTEDNPDGLLSEEFSAIAFMAHPYGWPIIGWMDDIRRITPAQLRAFYDVYYVPNNAILVVVGDVDAGRVLGRIREVFGQIPRGAEPPPVTAVEPRQVSDRRVTVRKEGARAPTVYVGWHVPTYRSADAPALELLSTIVSAGRASRLYRKLVYEQRLALSAGGDYQYFAFDPSLFWFWATPLPGQTPEALEKALMAEVELLKTEMVPDEELARGKNQIEASFVWRQDSVHSRASSLARFELQGSWQLIDRFVPAVRAVTAADIQRVARAYFPAERKNVGILLPADPPAAAGK